MALRTRDESKSGSRGKPQPDALKKNAPGVKPSSGGDKGGPRAPVAKAEKAAAKADDADDVENPDSGESSRGFGNWVVNTFREMVAEWRPYMVSFTVHAMLVPILAIMMGQQALKEKKEAAPTFEAVTLEEEPEPVVFDGTDIEGEEFEVPPDDFIPPPNAVAGDQNIVYDDSTEFVDGRDDANAGGFKDVISKGPELGGPGTDFKSWRNGPAMRGPGGMGGGSGKGNYAGAGGDGTGFGKGRGASFFGRKARGNKFVFLIDNSTSMGQGRFETALKELYAAVEKLTPKQKFYVFFFSDTSYAMFWPQPVNELIPATEENKYKLQAWLKTVEMCSGTKAESAMRKAIEMKPSAIYLLGDGAFADRTVEVTTDLNEGRIPVHVFGMEVNDVERQTFEKFAKENKGTYRDVEIDPEMAAKARDFPIKRNRTRGPVWGVTLQ